MLEDYRKALSDAQQSISLDETFVKGYLRAAKCQTMLGEPDLSIVWYDKALQLQPRNRQAVEEVRCPCVVMNIVNTLPRPPTEETSGRVAAAHSKGQRRVLKARL